MKGSGSMQVAVSTTTNESGRSVAHVSKRTVSHSAPGPAEVEVAALVAAVVAVVCTVGFELIQLAYVIGVCVCMCILVTRTLWLR